jgi:hypothetical protein
LFSRIQSSRRNLKIRDLCGVKLKISWSGINERDAQVKLEKWSINQNCEIEWKIANLRNLEINRYQKSPKFEWVPVVRSTICRNFEKIQMLKYSERLHIWLILKKNQYQKCWKFEWAPLVRSTICRNFKKMQMLKYSEILQIWAILNKINSKRVPSLNGRPRFVV